MRYTEHGATLDNCFVTNKRVWMVHRAKRRAVTTGNATKTKRGGSMVMLPCAQKYNTCRTRGPPRHKCILVLLRAVKKREIQHPKTRKKATKRHHHADVVTIQQYKVVCYFKRFDSLETGLRSPFPTRPWPLACIEAAIMIVTVQ